MRQITLPPYFLNGVIEDRPSASQPGLRERDVLLNIMRSWFESGDSVLQLNRSDMPGHWAPTHPNMSIPRPTGGLFQDFMPHRYGYPQYVPASPFFESQMARYPNPATYRDYPLPNENPTPSRGVVIRRGYMYLRFTTRHTPPYQKRIDWCPRLEDAEVIPAESYALRDGTMGPIFECLLIYCVGDHEKEQLMQLLQESQLINVRIVSDPVTGRKVLLDNDPQLPSNPSNPPHPASKPAQEHVHYDGVVVKSNGRYLKVGSFTTSTREISWVPELADADVFPISTTNRVGDVFQELQKYSQNKVEVDQLYDLLTHSELLDVRVTSNASPRPRIVLLVDKTEPRPNHPIEDPARHTTRVIGLDGKYLTIKGKHVWGQSTRIEWTDDLDKVNTVFPKTVDVSDALAYLETFCTSDIQKESLRKELVAAEFIPVWMFADPSRPDGMMLELIPSESGSLHVFFAVRVDGRYISQRGPITETTYTHNVSDAMLYPRRVAERIVKSPIYQYARSVEVVELVWSGTGLGLQPKSEDASPASTDPDTRFASEDTSMCLKKMGDTAYSSSQMNLVLRP